MSDYEIKNGKLSGSISSIKASLFDVTSELNTRILSLSESTNEEDIKLKKELINRLSNIMKLSNSINDEIISIDKNLDGNIEVSKENNSIEETEEDDNTVVISDKAIDDMMNVENEDDVTEVNIGTEEVKEETPVEENKPVQQDNGDAIVLDLSAYEKLKGKNVSSDDSDETEVKEEDTAVEGNGEKLFDLDNVGEVELNEEMKTTETTSTTESPVNVAELDQGDAISLKLTDYEKLKGKKLDNDDSEEKEESPEENESVEEPVITDEVSEEKTEVKEEVSEEEVEDSTDEEPEVNEETPVEDDTEEAEVTEEAPVEENTESDTTKEVTEEKVEEAPVVTEPTEETKVEETPEVKEEPVVEEKPQLTDAEKSIEQQKEAVTNKKISYIINKDNIDPAKAILVTSLQFEKLLLSRDEQKTLCKLRKYMVMPGEREETVDLEAMLQEAEDLYKKGDTAAAEELYNKISELNKN